MRKQIAAANWKMNLTLAQGNELVQLLLQQDTFVDEKKIAVLGVPFPYLVTIKEKLKDKPFFYVAAQNCSDKKSGAFTGETSAEMLQSIGIEYVILGHSERREYFNESNQLLADKINMAFIYGLKPIFCCGEALSVREAGTQNEHVAVQLKESLFHLSAEQLKQVVIAYEPIWAIGTGKTATTEQAQEMHAFIRSVLAEHYGAAAAGAVSILYGGSVKASNAKEIFGNEDVDGGLVGGASLVAIEFAGIINSLT